VLDFISIIKAIPFFKNKCNLIFCRRDIHIYTRCIPIIQRIFFKHFTSGCGPYRVQKVRNQLKN
jgi:hypothetical protein